MKQIGVVEASAQLSDLLDDVARGEEVTILRDGKPAARLVATLGAPMAPLAPEYTPEDIERRREAIGRIRAMAKNRGQNFSQEEIKSWIEDGRH